jgi:hypothetical protein
METYRNDLNDDVVQSQKYRIRAFLVPKLGNHAKSADIAVEFLNVNNLSDEEIANYEQGVAFIKGIENPFKLKPSKVVELVAKKVKGFNMTLHTKCWKFYESRPREIETTFKGEYSSYIEGFDHYLYSMKWINFLIKELKNKQKMTDVKSQAIL